MHTNKLRTAVATISLIALSSSALAAGLEVGGGALLIGTDDVSVTSAGVNLGYRVDENLAFEFGFYTGGSDDVNIGFTEVNIEVDSVLAARIKYGMNFGDTALGYISAGYAGFRSTASGSVGTTRLSLSDNADGATLGLGVDFKFSENWGGSVEYIRTFGDLESGNVGVFSVKYLMN